VVHDLFNLNLCHRKPPTDHSRTSTSPYDPTYFPGYPKAPLSRRQPTLLQKAKHKLPTHNI
jgi:hypothetical protein